MGNFSEDTQVYRLDHGLYQAVLDPNVHFHLKASDEPDGSPWLFADAYAETAQRGFLSGSVSVWTRSGKLLASGRSLSVLRRVGEPRSRRAFA